MLLEAKPSNLLHHYFLDQITYRLLQWLQKDRSYNLDWALLYRDANSIKVLVCFRQNVG